MPKISIEPFLRWVAEDVAGFPDEGFNLADTPSLLLDLDARPRAPVPPPKPAPEALPPPPEPVERCTNEGSPMKLPDAVQAAAMSKVQTVLKPVSEKLSRLRAVLDSYEAVARRQS
jgi:hypothetical protein